MFSLTEKQIAKINKFIKQEEKKTKGEYGTIGGGYTYSFTPTSVGVVIRVQNNVTKKEIDVSDYDLW